MFVSEETTTSDAPLTTVILPAVVTETSPERFSPPFAAIFTCLMLYSDARVNLTSPVALTNLRLLSEVEATASTASEETPSLTAFCCTGTEVFTTPAATDAFSE